MTILMTGGDRVPDPIEIGEASAERHADRFYGEHQFQCAGCFRWFNWDVAVAASPNPYSPAICPECAYE
jgi:hypothetical protein